MCRSNAFNAWCSRAQCLQTSLADIDGRHHHGHGRKSSGLRTAFAEGEEPPKDEEPPKEGGPDEQKAEEKAEKAEDDKDEKDDYGKEHGGHKDIGAVTVQEEETLNLSPDADVLPLCEDLNSDQVHMGDSCWSTCTGQCPNDVLAQGEGLAFDFDEIGPGHPGCTSHFECVGNQDRVLCHAVQAVEAGFSSPWPLVGAACSPQLPPSLRQWSPVVSTSSEARLSQTTIPVTNVGRRHPPHQPVHQAHSGHACGPGSCRSKTSREFL